MACLRRIGALPALLLTAAAAISHAATPRDEAGYRLAVPPYAFEFPADHAAHDDFATEWWYYTGHLDAGERMFGFELTFFRVGVDRSRLTSDSRWALHTLYFAHLALTDEAGRQFRYHQRVGRPSLGMSGADTTRYHVWIDDWVAKLEPDGRTHALRAREGRMGIDLTLTPRKPPVIHGHDGVSQKAAGEGRASHYYSLTRLEGSGVVYLDGTSHDVQAVAWMDHEFGSNQLTAEQVGWDWFSLQLDDGRELMLYDMRLRSGASDAYSSGTLVGRDGTSQHLDRDAFVIESTGEWESPHSSGVYPSAWRVRVPSEGLDLAVTPVLRDQELAVPGGITYWEGAVTVNGRSSGNAVNGRGYVELTGYAGRVPKF
jgi:predicted secreted hydrolase